MFHIIQNVLYIDYYDTFYLQTFSSGIGSWVYDIDSRIGTFFLIYCKGCKDNNLFGIILK